MLLLMYLCNNAAPNGTGRQHHMGEPSVVIDATRANMETYLSNNVALAVCSSLPQASDAELRQGVTLLGGACSVVSEPPKNDLLSQDNENGSVLVDLGDKKERSRGSCVGSCSVVSSEDEEKEIEAIEEIEAADAGKPKRQDSQKINSARLSLSKIRIGSLVRNFSFQAAFSAGNNDGEHDDRDRFFVCACPLVSLSAMWKLYPVCVKAIAALRCAPYCCSPSGCFWVSCFSSCTSLSLAGGNGVCCYCGSDNAEGHLRVCGERNEYPNIPCGFLEEIACRAFCGKWSESLSEKEAREKREAAGRVVDLRVKKVT